MDTLVDSRGFAALLLFEDQGPGFVVLWQLRNGRIYADVIGRLRGEHPRDILARCDVLPKLLDRVTYKYGYQKLMPVDAEGNQLGQERVVSVSVNIKKCPGGQVADLSIQKGILRTY
jgi:hypothetical protein